MNVPTATKDQKSQFNNAEIAEKKEEIAEDKYRLMSSAAFMIVVIVIGVPMWWKTTEVYRVSLPHSDIVELSDQPLRAQVRIAIFTFQEERAKLLISELGSIYAHNEFWQIHFEHIRPFEQALHAKTPNGLEQLILKQHNGIAAGDFLFIEWPKMLEDDVLMTTERSAFIRNETSASKMRTVIESLLLQTHRIQQILSNDQQYGSKSEAPQAEYDVMVSVLNPRPDKMNVKWHVQMAVETYLQPFLEAVSHISNYTLKTQWRYQLGFDTELKQIRDTTKYGRHYKLPESALPHIITAIEKNLGVGITAKSTINLVVYVPPCHEAPVRIYDHNNKRTTRNRVDSFISQKWGGIIIANPPTDACLSQNDGKEPVEFYVNTNDVMQIMLYHLQRLLDISIDLPISGVKLVALEQIESRRWEYDAYLRRSCVMHIATATNTLQSLIKLLDNISYIVINDKVGAAINDAYNNIVLAKSALADGQLLMAGQRARAAFLASEHAFFDASLLAQLYFPDEQKYAIYIPLFLPIMVPVVTSFPMIRKLVIKLRSRG